MSQNITDPLIGRTIGKYHITGILGIGATSTVYRARQTRPSREIALKVIDTTNVETDTIVTRFQREADAIAALEHPHIIPIYDYGQHNSLLYLAMALKSGGDLGTLMARQRLPLPEVVRLIGQIAEALDYAHEHHVVHRDMKPANVLLDEEKNCFLTDFGLARRLGESRLTGAGTVVGSPTYMAPEIWRGEDASPQSDVYSLGVLVFQMLTGKPPYEDKLIARVMIKHVTEPIPSALSIRPELPLPIDQVISQALAKEPDKRLRSAGHLASMLRAVIMEAIKREETQSNKPEATLTYISSPTALRHSGRTNNAHNMESEEPDAPRAKRRFPAMLLLLVLALLAIVAVLLAVAPSLGGN